MNILITGGAGYKGVRLAAALLKKGHKVTVLDNFMYGFDPILPFVPDKRFSVIAKDIRNIDKSDTKRFDIIYHLAAISGYPACEANPHSAQMINVEGTKKLIKSVSSSQLLVYASTTSFYGSSGEEMDETSKPTPVSLYGITKYKAEKLIMQRKNSIAFRFATIFGVSPKMRNDLMVNDFVYRAISERSLVLFDSQSIRTFLHLDDAIQAYLMILAKRRKMSGEVFNVGSNKMNFSKMQLANMIQKYVKFEIIDSSLDDKDKRHFIIKYDKITKLGFKPKKTMDQGIRDLVKLYSFYHPHIHFKTI